VQLSDAILKGNILIRCKKLYEIGEKGSHLLTSVRARTTAQEN
jgi:hypothetical protein